MFDDSIVLNNGVKIPQLGLGIWFIDEDKTADASEIRHGNFIKGLMIYLLYTLL